MFNKIYFICPIVFSVLAIAFSLGITEKLPQGLLSYNLGKLDADDIRKMDDAKRLYLLKQVIVYFGLAIVLTFLVGLAFALLGFDDYSPLVCNLLGFFICMGATSMLIKKANTIKSELTSK